MSQGKGGKAATVKGKEEAPAPPQPAPEVPPQPRDATRAEKEEIVYLNLSELFPFKDHPFGVRDDAEMKGLVESVKDNGVHQPALVRPREGGGYEIIAGHRRQRASELAGFANMPCIVRNMTDDEAILAMTDDNLRHREKILPMEKAQSLKMQVEAISHQGAKLADDDAKDVGKRSTETPRCEIRTCSHRSGCSAVQSKGCLFPKPLFPGTASPRPATRSGRYPGCGTPKKRSTAKTPSISSDSLKKAPAAKAGK